MPNQSLHDAYTDFAKKLSLPVEIMERCSAPHLLMAPAGWNSSKRRLVVVGKETQGWGTNGAEDLTAFAGNPSTVPVLMRGYESFAFAKNSPKNYSSPFWRAYRHLQTASETTPLWTNLFRFDIDGGSVIHNCNHAELDAILRAQHGLLQRELAILNPTAIVFFTGPDYDRALQSEFPNARFESISDHPLHQFARVNAVGLPFDSFRLYHPKYLRLSGHWQWLDELAELVAPIGT